MNDILARRARRATVGIALSAALVAGIAPATAIAAETSSPTGAVALQTEDAAAAKEKAYAAMQEALKNLEAAKDAAGPEILETIEHVITDLQSLRDRMLKEADDSRGPLLYLQANVDAAQAKYDEAKAAADKATSPEITQPTETTSPSNSTQPTETTQPTGSSATGKDTSPNSTKQANSSSGKQADTTADKLANTGDTTPSAIALAGIATAGLGITATATRRIRNSK